MNLIRADLGIPTITCANYDDITKNLNTIYADLKVVNEFFDPFAYSDNQEAPLAS